MHLSIFILYYIIINVLGSRIITLTHWGLHQLVYKYTYIYIYKYILYLAVYD